jgi:DNA-binding PadR family transcriptional regulator
MLPRSVTERFLPLRATHFHILLTVVTAPVHGYGIRREVEERTAGRIVLAAGTLYETLNRLERDGLIEETEVPAGSEAEASARWRFYRATKLGRAVLAAETDRLESDLSAARSVLPARG